MNNKGILATVEILSNTALTESQRALLNAIESCGTNLISMEHGKMSLENSTFDLIHLLQEIGDGTFFLYITTYLLNDIVPDP
ncbi:hypothetical protein BC936DRAFT_149181 [Jimgerdemannia flammicorona]|uniref:Uncharacterized protein n=1 Tax=Jimgerdemannia flammicorona TaxID=994334 RepID=A0A433D1D8_9FUNG|nr:hypothetical protein BC936DRAFT_149181 [Jimgerdemannia flammicorona]